MAHGKRLTDSLIEEIAEAYAAGIEPLSDLRGSAWYRKQIIRCHGAAGYPTGAGRQLTEPEIIVSAVGQTLPMIDAQERVSGRINYALNVELPGMLVRQDPAQPVSPCADSASWMRRAQNGWQESAPC